MKRYIQISTTNEGFQISNTDSDQLKDYFIFLDTQKDFWSEFHAQTQNKFQNQGNLEQNRMLILDGIIGFLQNNDNDSKIFLDNIMGTINTNIPLQKNRTHLSRLSDIKINDKTISFQYVFDLLYSACTNKYLNTVKYLLEKCPENMIKIRDLNLYTLLHIASYYGHLPVVEFLLDKGADIKAQNRDKVTPLREAVQKGHLPVVEFLVSKGADINEISRLTRTLLHTASYNGHLPVVKFLVSKGADINAKDLFEQTALHLASQNGHLPVVEFLVSKGAEINAIDIDDNTPLDLASLNNHSSVKEFLISKGAKTSIQLENTKEENNAVEDDSNDRRLSYDF